MKPKLILCLALVMFNVITVLAEDISTNIILQPCQIGSYKARAGLRVQDFNGRRELLVQFAFYVGEIGDAKDFSKKLVEIPTQRVSAWVLTDESRALHLIEKSPLPGRCPSGSSGDGSAGYGFVNFRFDRSSGGKPESVVIKMGNELQVFPLSVRN